MPPLGGVVVSVEEASGMDALELLRKDHVRAMTVMRELGRTEGPESRQALFVQLERDLDVHEAIEEEILYPALRSRATEMVIEGLEEHQVVDKLLGELDSLPFESRRSRWET